MRLLLVFYYYILPLLNLALLIGFVVCLIALLIKIIRHKEGKKSLLIILGLIFIFANVLSFGLAIFVAKEIIYYDENSYLNADGDKYLVEWIPEEATEILYLKQYPASIFGSIVDGISYKIDSKDVSEQIENIFKKIYYEGYDPSGNEIFLMPYEQWIDSESDYYTVRLNEKLLCGDNIEDYRVVYCIFGNKTGSYLFVNEKTGRFVELQVNYN